jgi:hypothetical protein
MDVDMISAIGRQGRDQQPCLVRLYGQPEQVKVTSPLTTPLQKFGMFPKWNLA